MPILSRFLGIVIKLIYFDDEQHHKPHVHVKYGEYTASVAVDGEVLAGSLPIKQLRLVQAWLILHEDEVYKAWNSAVAGKPFDQINPLR